MLVGNWLGIKMRVMAGFVKISCLLVLFGPTRAISGNCTSEEESDKTVILSRRKRFIVFPEGSSFQLVFCFQYPLITPVGDIFLVGNTVALAFELPQDPYSPFNHRADPLHRRGDTRVIYYTDEVGKVLHKQPYNRKRKILYNPAMSRRSVDSQEENQGNNNLDRKQMHAAHTRDYMRGDNLDDRAVEFHRSSRIQLYEKIETLLQGFGADSRQCLLKTLCLVGKTQNSPQGAFLQELLRAVFTLPKNNETDDDNREFDEASKAAGSCDEMYPDCNTPLTTRR